VEPTSGFDVCLPGREINRKALALFIRANQYITAVWGLDFLPLGAAPSEKRTHA